MASFNRVILVGNLTRDVELRYIPSGMAVCDLGLAVNDRRKNAQGEWIDDPVFVDVTLWGRTAEVASEYLSKGSPVLIEGRLKYDQWEGNDGQKRSRLRVVGEKMQMLGTRQGDAPRAARAGSAARADRGEQAPPPAYDEPPEEGPNFSGPPAPPPEDDIPF
jgi:single-strand DNA-binding protein